MEPILFERIPICSRNNANRLIAILWFPKIIHLDCSSIEKHTLHLTGNRTSEQHLRNYDAENKRRMRVPPPRRDPEEKTTRRETLPPTLNIAWGNSQELSANMLQKESPKK